MVNCTYITDRPERGGNLSPALTETDLGRSIMAVLTLSTQTACVTIAHNPHAAPIGGNVASFAQAKHLRDLPTYLKGGRI